MDGTTINQKFAYLFGAVYLVIGLAGFAVTGGVEFASQEGNPLILFDVNPLHNIVHLAIGAAFVLGARAGAMAARSVNMAIGVVYTLVGIAGLLIDRESSANILALNMADNWLHLVSGVAALGVAMYAGREMATSRGTPTARM